MRKSYNCGSPTTAYWTLAFVLLLSVSVTFMSCSSPYLYRISANVNFRNFSIQDDEDDDHEGNNKVFTVADSENVRRLRSTGQNNRHIRKICENGSLHILHRMKKIKRWNAYHQNRFKRSTTVEHATVHFTNLVNVTPNVSMNYVTEDPSAASLRRQHFLDESHLLERPSQPIYVLEKTERNKRNFSSASRRLKWPIKRVVKVEGDVIIGALMMVHSRGADGNFCGPIMPQGGVQALEVMLYTLGEINKKPDMPFKIGAHILDDCDTDTYGLEMALDFIKGQSLMRRA